MCCFGVGVQQCLQFFSFPVLHLQFQTADLLLQLQNILADLKQGIIDGGIRDKILMLCQITNGAPFGDNDFTAVSRFLADDNF